MYSVETSSDKENQGHNLLQKDIFPNDSNSIVSGTTAQFQYRSHLLESGERSLNEFHVMCWA